MQDFKRWFWGAEMCVLGAWFCDHFQIIFHVWPAIYTALYFIESEKVLLMSIEMLLLLYRGKLMRVQIFVNSKILQKNILVGCLLFTWYIPHPQSFVRKISLTIPKLQNSQAKVSCYTACCILAGSTATLKPSTIPKPPNADDILKVFYWTVPLGLC